MNQIPKAVYSKEFREKAVKLARCGRIGGRASAVDINENVSELGTRPEDQQVGARELKSEPRSGTTSL